MGSSPSIATIFCFRRGGRVWSIATVLKTVGCKSSVGSNPTLSANFLRSIFRIIGITLAFQASDAGSNPARCSNLNIQQVVLYGYVKKGTTMEEVFGTFSGMLKLAKKDGKKICTLRLIKNGCSLYYCSAIDKVISTASQAKYKELSDFKNTFHYSRHFRRITSTAAEDSSFQIELR